ncbi:MAG: hypothetical protein GY865_17400 [candidate division Zixibacteria bacterium]|nr:hypothetical protein [candidate division Zixibacteria bacterium]
MKFLFLFLILFLSISLAGQDLGSRHADGLGFGTSLPDGWIPVESSPMEMIIKKSDDPNARLSILQYEIADSNQLTTRFDILEAIEGLYNQLDVGEFKFEDIKLNLGEERATFNINYIENENSIKPDSDTVFVNLKGIIVRTKDNRQIFYLMRGYKTSASGQSISADLDNMINSFNITIPLSDSLFQKKPGYGYVFLFVVIVLMAFFYYRNKKVQESRNPLGGDSKYFWRCPDCQLANHVEKNSCTRCGTERFIDNAVK